MSRKAPSGVGRTRPLPTTASDTTLEESPPSGDPADPDVAALDDDPSMTESNVAGEPADSVEPAVPVADEPRTQPATDMTTGAARRERRDGKVWIRCRARHQRGFWRAGIHWPHADVYRLVPRQVADRVLAEPRLVAQVVEEPPAGYEEPDALEGD